jgi:hypothetical protein
MYHWNFVFQSNFGLIDDATVDNRQKRHYPNAIHGKRVNLGKPDAVGGTDKGGKSCTIGICFSSLTSA